MKNKKISQACRQQAQACQCKQNVFETVPWHAVKISEASYCDHHQLYFRSELTFWVSIMKSKLSCPAMFVWCLLLYLYIIIKKSDALESLKKFVHYCMQLGLFVRTYHCKWRLLSHAPKLFLMLASTLSFFTV